MSSLSPNAHYLWSGEDLHLTCYVQPAAKETRWAGEHGGFPKIRLQAPAQDGKANQALIKYLAKAFEVPLSSIALTKGQCSRQKTVRIAAPKNLPPEAMVYKPTQTR